MKKNVSPSKLAWARIFRSPKKPRLSRKVAPSPKVNLNLLWGDFERELSRDLDMDIRSTVSYQNAVNENLANERSEVDKISALIY